MINQQKNVWAWERNINKTAHRNRKRPEMIKKSRKKEK